MIKTTIIDGVEVPILPAKAVEIVKNKRTGTVYASKQEFEQDVANPETDTTVEDFSQDVQITVASLSVFGKTK
jgi:hypothetical protein